MKLITYRRKASQSIGLLTELGVIDLASAHKSLKEGLKLKCQSLPSDMIELLRMGEDAMNDARTINNSASAANSGLEYFSVNDDLVIMAPVPVPTSMRDGYAFRQHVEAARRNRGVEMIPEFDEIPIFYFTNHMAVFGPGPIEVRAMHCDKLDFELECAIVIGKECRDVSAAEADEYIAGYTVMNDWSARTLQMHEMKLNLGPAKGKDFATSIGPWLLTRDDLQAKRIEGSQGERYDLKMRATVNGTEVSTGNVKDMTWTFAQIVERASYGVTLHPGDVIGSGTCGTGCFLELNGSKVYDPAWWLKPGDVVTCEIEELGVLSNSIVLSPLDAK